MTVSIDLAQLDWVPTQGTGLGDVRVEPGATDNTATVVIDAPFGTGIEMSGSIEHGALVLDTSDIPDLFGPIRERIDGWVAAFNGHMKHNGRQLDGFTVRRGTVTLTKSVVAAPATTEATVVPPGVGPTKASPPSVDGDRPPDATETPPGDETGTPWGCLTKIVGAGVLALGGVGLYLGLAGDGGDDGDGDTEQVEVADEESQDESVSVGDDAAATDDDTPADDARDEESSGGGSTDDDTTGDPSETDDGEPDDVPSDSAEAPAHSVIAPFDDFQADLYRFTFPTRGDVWNVPNADLLGSTELPTSVGGELVVRRHDDGSSATVMGFVQIPGPGAIEIYGFGGSGQNGFTAVAPGTLLWTFGVPGPVTVAPCEGGLLFSGSVDDSSGSFGSTFYFPPPAGDFPPGSTGSAGVEFGEPDDTASFGFDPTGPSPIIIGDPVSNPFRSCLGDADVLRATTPFFNTGFPPSRLAPLTPLFGEQAPWFVDREPGPVPAFLFGTAPAGDVIDCATGAPTDSGPGADLLGINGAFDGSVLYLDVFTAMTPDSVSADWSSAILVSLYFPNDSYRVFTYEQHDGRPLIGELDDEGEAMPADIELFPGFLRLEIPVDSAPDVVVAEGFNTPMIDGTKTCDVLFVAVDPFSHLPPPGYFSPAVTAPSEFELQPSPSDGWLFTDGDDQVLVRLIDGCRLSDAYWVVVQPSGPFDFEVTVTDVNGDVRTYAGADGAAITDTSAFATCP